MEIWPGQPYPLGATFDGTGTNFALFSEVAERVELCLIGERGGETRIAMPEVDAYVWHCYLPTVQPGQRYGYRVHGPVRPAPRASLQPEQAAARSLRQGDVRARSTGIRRCSPTTWASPDSRNDDDSGPHMMHGVVINPFFDWTGDRSLRIPYNDSVIYEAHVKGLTAMHPEVPDNQRAPTPASRTRR